MKYYCTKYDRECIDCGDCDEFCDLQPNKKCDSCGKCLQTEKGFNSIQITEIIEE